MEKRTVRIYKAPDGKGKYLNKTSQFLHRAQEGAEVDNGAEQYLQYIQAELQKQTAPEEIYSNLIKAGIPEETAKGLIQHVMQSISQPGTSGEEQAEGESQMGYQPDEAEQFQDGGEQELIDQYSSIGYNPEEFDMEKLIENTPGTQDLSIPNMEQYMPSYENIGWDDTNTDPYGNFSFATGGSKKSFAKNVLNFLKQKQEGGDGNGESKPLGKGNLQDTSTDTVSKRKTDFLNTLKNHADKAKTEELYGKMMQSGDPSLMQIANTLGQGDNAQPIPLAPIAQEGGFTGGQDPMEYFQEGGYDAQYAQDGAEVRKAKIRYVPHVKTVPGGLRNLTPWNQLFSRHPQIQRSNPYIVGSNTAYRGNMQDFHPVERKVTKTGLFGRPKEWTDVYSNAPQGNKQQHVNPINTQAISSHVDHAGLSKDVWDDLSFGAKHAIRKGDRQATRNEKRYNEQLEKDREFENFGGGKKGNAKGEKLKDKEEVVEQVTDFVPEDPRFANDQMDKKLAPNRYGGLRKYFQQGGVNNPKPFQKTKSNATSAINEQEGALHLPANPDNTLINKDPQGPIYTMDPRMNGSINNPEEQTIAINNKRNNISNVNGEESVNVFNAGAQGVLGLINRAQQRNQDNQFMQNNFTADNIYAHSHEKDRGDWVDYGSQLGQYRPDQTGQTANGRFAYGQEGGFMQEGGVTEGEETYMTEEELADFLANGGEVEYL